MNDLAMRETLLGKFVARFYDRLPLRRKWLTLATRSEGGQMRSVSLRRILQRKFGVRVGNYSYGSLLEPGGCDRHTTIGAYASIGPGVRRFGAAHPLDGLTLHPYWYNPALGFVTADQDVDRTSCSIGNDVWIGANAIILPGCREIGDGAVIGAGSIVTKDVAPYSVVAGNPARLIHTRLDEGTREALLTSEYWMHTPEQASKILDSIGEVRENSQLT